MFLKTLETLPASSPTIIRITATFSSYVLAVSNISAEMLDTANTYDDKVAVIRMIVGDEAGRVSSVCKNMMEKE